jgi:hypothetical protein
MLLSYVVYTNFEYPALKVLFEILRKLKNISYYMAAAVSEHYTAMI